MGVAANTGSTPILDPEMAFQTFEAEGEPYVRFRLQSQLCEKDWSTLAASWLVEKDTKRAKARRVRRRRIRAGWVVAIMASVAAASYIDESGFLQSAARTII